MQVWIKQKIGRTGFYEFDSVWTTFEKVMEDCGVHMIWKTFDPGKWYGEYSDGSGRVLLIRSEVRG